MPWPSSWMRDPADHEVDDLGDLGLRQLVEDDRLVDAVQELRPEVLLQRVVDLLLHPLVGDGLVGLAEADVGLAQILRCRGSTS